jgi:hypothetical protein
MPYRGTGPSTPCHEIEADQPELLAGERASTVRCLGALLYGSAFSPATDLLDKRQQRLNVRLLLELAESAPKLLDVGPHHGLLEESDRRHRAGTVYIRMVEVLLDGRSHRTLRP